MGPVGKSGNTIGIRKPVLGNIRRTWGMDQSDVTEGSIPLTIDKITGVDLNFSDADLSITIEDFSERYIVPNAMKAAADIDMQAGIFIKNNVFNTVKSSAFGTAPNALSYFLSGGQKIKEGLVPMDSPLNCIVSPRTEAAMVNALSGQYNPQNNISDMFLKGQMSRAAGFDWYTSQTLPAHTHGSCTTGSSPAVTGYTETTMTISNVTSGGTLNAGDTFTVSGCYAVNLETKQTYASLQQFVVTTTTTASGTNITVSVSPAIVTSGPLQTVSAAPTSGGVTFDQTTANQVAQTDLILHEKSFAIAFADLELPRNMDMASVLSQDGISIRFIRGYDIVNARQLSRMDIFWGIAATRPEWAAKILS